MKITIRSTPKLNKVGKKLHDVPNLIDNRISKAIVQSAFLIEGESKKFTPVDTGRLRASIYTTVRKDIDVAIVQPKTNYALFVHDGTKYMKGRQFMLKGTKKAFPRIKSIFHEEMGLAIKLKF